MKKKKGYVGDIYFIDPSHVIEKNRLQKYTEIKGSKSSNKRPVMVGIEKSSKKVQISDISTKATKAEINKKMMVPLKNTKLKQKSYVDSSTKSKSELTRKHFKVGEPPLVNKSKIKVDNRDIAEYELSRKKRYK
ncbi:hypothetical protein N7603_03555 [Acholeplasma vituli]|uniref:Uncharacterized protein n=1 Tax=Paracholeplasma vituli TaxID=69473 RepID=A0ABT2PUV3_9MOLU|nr:hypothetical protein [Paracholeplasma vituli]MCU0104726.1 hypothetical protein [Paracholeplasma vituli]